MFDAKHPPVSLQSQMPWDTILGRQRSRKPLGRRNSLSLPMTKTAGAVPLPVHRVDEDTSTEASSTGSAVKPDPVLARTRVPWLMRRCTQP